MYGQRIPQHVSYLVGVKDPHLRMMTDGYVLIHPLASGETLSCMENFFLRRALSFPVGVIQEPSSWMLPIEAALAS
jgi:hypothetical protein